MLYESVIDVDYNHPLNTGDYVHKNMFTLGHAGFLPSVYSDGYI